MHKKKNMTKKENNYKVFVILSSKLVLTKEEMINNNKNSVMMDFDLILYKFNFTIHHLNIYKLNKLINLYKLISIL